MKRFHGWEPETTYVYDDAGYLVSSRPEQEWDDQEQTVMLALAAYRASLCPLCGLPFDVCTAMENEGKFSVTGPTRCHKATALAVAANKLKPDHPYRDALMFSAYLKT